MTGSFNSAIQANKDSSYFNISLHMYPIWKERKEHWLYVEQAVNSMQDKPYRQRLYKLEKTGKNTFVSKVFTIQNPEEYIGKWKDPDYFDKLTQEDIDEKEGCAVYLEKVGEHTFKGSTKAQDCKSSLRGASYATSIVQIQEDLIKSWDQGFDSNGIQVWGAVKGGYVFNKLD